MNTTKNIKKIVGTSLIIGVSLIFIYPLVYTLLASMKTNVEIYANPFGLPKEFTFENFSKAWNQAKMYIYFKNSVFITFITTVGQLFIGSMAAYVISRYRLKLSAIALGFFTIGMMIPIQSILIPIAKMSIAWNASDTYWFLLGIYIAGGLPSTIFIMSNYMNSFPDEIEEAATIDGCSTYRFYGQMLLPLSKPIFVTMGIMCFISCWNELMVAMVLIKDNMKKTLSLGLLNFTGAYTTDNAGLCAAIMITVLPTILVYIFLQEHVEKGLSEGAVKG